MKNIFLLFIIIMAFSNINSQTYIYWTDADQNDIKRAKLDGSDVKTIVPDQNTPRGIAIDYEHGKLYFADGHHDAITSVNLDGSNVKYLNSTSEPIDVFYDKKLEVIYYSDVLAGTISKISTDGTHDQVIISNQIQPAFLDVDVVNRHLYFTSRQGDKSIIYRINLDGSNIKEIINEEGYITGVAVNPYFNKMYWLNRKTKKLHAASLNGENKTDIAETSAACIGLEVDNINGKLYWSEKDKYNIKVVNTNGSDYKDFQSNIGIVGGISLDIKNGCTKIVEVFDTTYVTVTDTLLIDVTFTNINTVYNNVIKIYPNPTKDYIYIDLGESFSKIPDYTITFINTTGQKIYHSKFNNKITKIKVDDFKQNGLYFIQVKDESGNLIDIKKLVLE